MPPYVRSILQALFVTFLWSTSWVLIKVGLEEIPALMFAGLRYGLAFLLLAPLLLRRGVRAPLRSLSRREWGWLVALGVVMYTFTQGAQFLALERLPAQTTSLVLSFSPIAVAVLAAVWLGERPGWLQGLGVLVAVVGAMIFLNPTAVPGGQVVGLFIAAASVVFNAAAAVIGRYVNRSFALPAAAVTLVSMGVGALGLLGAGLATHGLPVLSMQSWLIIAWLAAVNTAFAFTLWNLTLQRLSATESSVINNTMLIQIAVLAWVFLGERLSAPQIAGLLLASVGTLVVQVGGARGRRRVLPPAVDSSASNPRP